MQREYETKRLNIIRPSVATRCEMIGNDLIIKFENSSDDVFIAEKFGSNFYDFHTRAEYSGDINLQCAVGDCHIDVMDNDVIPLIKYLFETRVKNTKLDLDIEKFLYEYKPVYYFNELHDLYRRLENELKPKEIIVKNKTIVKTYSSFGCNK